MEDVRDFPLAWALVDSGWHLVEEALGAAAAGFVLWPRRAGERAEMEV